MPIPIPIPFSMPVPVLTPLGYVKQCIISLLACIVASFITCSFFFQNKVGPDVSALEASLAPIERYALRVRTEVDPHHSLYFLTETQRREEVEAAGGDLDIDEIEGRGETGWVWDPSSGGCLLEAKMEPLFTGIVAWRQTSRKRCVV